MEADEQWSFVGAKQWNSKTTDQGDIWTFCAIDADTKLVICWLVGARSPENTRDFIADLATRVTNRIQLTTDGFGACPWAVRRAFDFARCDFAQLLKVFGQSHEEGQARRYSLPVVVETQPIRRIGRLDPGRISTSYVERLNLNTRQNCRRFIRLTNAFSKKAENHANAVALEFFAYNYIRPHGTLSKAAGRKTTPAMAAVLTDRVWSWEEVAPRRTLPRSRCEVRLRDEVSSGRPRSSAKRSVSRATATTHSCAAARVCTRSGTRDCVPLSTRASP